MPQQNKPDLRVAGGFDFERGICFYCFVQVSVYEVMHSAAPTILYRANAKCDQQTRSRCIISCWIGTYKCTV